VWVVWSGADGECGWLKWLFLRLCRVWLGKGFIFYRVCVVLMRAVGLGAASGGFVRLQQRIPSMPRVCRDISRGKTLDGAVFSEGTYPSPGKHRVPTLHSEEDSKAFWCLAGTL